MLSLTGIAKTYGAGKVKTHALNGVSLDIGAGEFVAIMGPSGCGKSTLLHILGLTDGPTSGSFRFMGEERPAGGAALGPGVALGRRRSPGATRLAGVPPGVAAALA